MYGTYEKKNFETVVEGWQTQSLFFWVAARQKTGYPGASLVAVDTYALATESDY